MKTITIPQPECPWRQWAHGRTSMWTLQDLIDDTYEADETKFYVFCDAGNGSSFGEAGQTMTYDKEDAKAYGHLVMRPTAAHRADDGTECAYASEWIDGSDGYRFQVRF